jgi:phospholipid transport system transporter-binding protein
MNSPLAPTLTFDDNTLRVAGTMGFAHARRLAQEGVAHLRGGRATVDLSAVGDVDSAALAVLLAWQRHQLRAGGTLEVRGAPESLHTLARVYAATDQLRWV